MKRLLITALCLFFCKLALSQNLVFNGDFELLTSCPTAPSQIANAVSWNNLQNHIGTSDYFNVCATDTQIQVPTNIYGFEPAASGSGYAGITLIIYYLTPEYREYIATQLTSPLIAGKKYALSLKYSLADACKYATADLGVYLSPSMPSGNSTWNPAPYAPQVSSPVMLNNKNGWTTVSMNYTAVGGEKYLVIGNFLSAANTGTALVPNPGWFDGVYVFLDDISLSEIPGALQLSADTAICAGDTATLFAHGNPPYQWATQTNPTGIFSTDSFVRVSPAVTTTFIVYGASDTSTITVSVRELPLVNLGKDTSLCEGQSLKLDAGGDTDTYRWQDGSSLPYFNVNGPGKYWLQVASDGCESSDTINIRYFPYPNADLGPDHLLCPGRNLALTANPENAIYHWSTGATSRIITTSAPGTYWTDVTINGCTARDSVVVEQQLKECDCLVMVPGVFTPNNDHLNDVLKVINTGNISVKQFAVFNRWGELVFRSYNMADGWDGLYLGLPADQGTYFYYLSYYCTRDQKEYLLKGDITLLR